jgi:hypothetical protein
MAVGGLRQAVGWGRAGVSGGVTAMLSTRFVTLAVPLLWWAYFAAVVAPQQTLPLRLVPWALCALRGHAGLCRGATGVAAQTGQGPYKGQDRKE